MLPEASVFGVKDLSWCLKLFNSFPQENAELIKGRILHLLSLGVKLERGHRTGPTGGILYKLYARKGLVMTSAGLHCILHSSGPDSSPGREHCVVFLGKTLYSHSGSLQQGV